MNTYGDIRARFEAAYNESINESANSNVGTWLSLAQTPNAASKKALFDSINKELFKGESPWGERLTLSVFDDNSFKNVFNYLNKNKKQMEMLFKQKIQGIGAGEIMLAYIVENLTVGGGSATVDLNLFDKSGKIFDECELKEATLTGSGFLEDWQLGANHAKISIQTINKFKKLYDAVKYKIDALNPDGAGKSLVKGFETGEWGTAPNGKRFIHFSNITEIPVGPDREFKMGPAPDGEILVTYQDEALGNLSDNKTIEKIKSILSTKATSNIETYDQIHTELIKEMGSIKEKFLFISTKGVRGSKSVQNFHFLQNLPDTTDRLQLQSITLNKCKFRVKAP